MTSVAALVFEDREPVALAGQTLAQRAAVIAGRLGSTPVCFAGGLPATFAGTAPVVLVAPNLLIDATALTDLIATADHDRGESPVVVRDNGEPVLVFVPAADAHIVMASSSMSEAIGRILLRHQPREHVAAGFCRRIQTQAAMPIAARALARHLNGPDESFFTKVIRRFSVPLSIRLVQLGVLPTQVTLAGLALAVLSAWCLAQGRYALGVTGGLLYYVSMVFDCSDGEVARLTLRDSAFGAWLETAVDYTTYLLLLGALVIAVGDSPAASAHRTAALLALIGSVVVIAVATYLRRRVAAADPGHFDESSAAAMAFASPIHRFASWSRQWIKRSTIAHLVLALALVNQLQALLYLWAFGAPLAAVVILFVAPFVVRRVDARPLRVQDIGAGR